MPPKLSMAKMGLMINELKVMKRELLPNEKEPDGDDLEMKEMDAWQKLKLLLNRDLRDLGKDVIRLNELRANAPEGRDPATIKLYSENSKKLKASGDKWKQMKELLMKDEAKKKLDEKTLNDRKRLMALLAKEIQEMGNKNAHVKGPKESETAKKLKERGEDRAKKRRDRGKRDRKKREKDDDDGKDDKKKKKKKKGEEDEGPDVDIQDEDLRDVKPLSQEEQQFYAEVEEAREEENKMLDEIFKGVTDLKVIAQDMNTSIKTTAAMTDEIGKQMDKTIATFDTSNARLQDMLEKSGGLSRWCPMLICIIVLIALVGYMINMLQ